MFGCRSLYGRLVHCVRARLPSLRESVKWTRQLHVLAVPVRPVPNPSVGLPAQILAGHTPRIDYVRNEETEEHPEIFAFRGLKQSWPALLRLMSEMQTHRQVANEAEEFRLLLLPEVPAIHRHQFLHPLLASANPTRAPRNGIFFIRRWRG